MKNPLLAHIENEFKVNRGGEYSSLGKSELRSSFRYASDIETDDIYLSLRLVRTKGKS